MIERVFLRCLRASWMDLPPFSALATSSAASLSSFATIRASCAPIDLPLFSRNAMDRWPGRATPVPAKLDSSTTSWCLQRRRDADPLRSAAFMIRDVLAARLAHLRSSGATPDYQQLARDVLGIRGAPPDLARRLVEQALVIEDRRDNWRRVGERVSREAPRVPGV